MIGTPEETQRRRYAHKTPCARYRRSGPTPLLTSMPPHLPCPSRSCNSPYKRKPCSKAGSALCALLALHLLLPTLRQHPASKPCPPVVPLKLLARVAPRLLLLALPPEHLQHLLHRLVAQLPLLPLLPTQVEEALRQECGWDVGGRASKLVGRWAGGMSAFWQQTASAGTQGMLLGHARFECHMHTSAGVLQ